MNKSASSCEAAYTVDPEDQLIDPEGQPEISRGRKPPVGRQRSHAPAGAAEILNELALRRTSGFDRACTTRRRGFTLLEVMLSVMILALIAGAIYRFVVSDLSAIKLSTDATARKKAIEALVAVLHEEFCNLAPGEQNALLGEAHKFNGKASDQVEWLTQAGNGLFTEAASGSWKVTLILRPQENSNTYVLGVLRQLPDNSNKQENWLPLLPNVDAIELRYFDPRLNAWLEKWSDPQSRPSLVRLRIWRTDQDVPYETVIELPPTRLPT